MLSHKLKRWLVTNRAWEIYSQLQKLSPAEASIISDIEEQIHLAITTDIIQLDMVLPRVHKKLVVRETYAFPQNELRIASYSYSLIEIGKSAIIRADSAPHHERDYRGKRLSHFPNHLHDEAGRICSFSGKLENFVELVKPYLRRR